MNCDYYKSTKWGSELALKDYGHAKSLAEEVSSAPAPNWNVLTQSLRCRMGVQTKGLDLAAQHLRDMSNYATEQEGRKGDIAGIYGAVRQEAGLNFDN